MTNNFTMPAKYPDMVCDYYWDWTDDIPDGDALVSVEITVTDGLVLDSKTQNGNVTKFVVSGGDPSQPTGRAQMLATLASGLKPGRNVGLPVIRR